MQTGKGVAMFMIKVRGLKKKAAYNACKVAEWIGDFVGRGSEVNVERTKEVNLLLTCSTLGSRKLAVQKMFWDVGVEISMAVPLDENECKAVIHGVDVELDEDESIAGLKADWFNVLGMKRLRTRGLPMVTFRGKQVPEAVTFGYMCFSVKVYVPRPIRCWKCQRFGHVEAWCQAGVQCPMCGRTQGHGG